MIAIELCAGGGGQALGLELAGFEHAALVENDRYACETLRLNRPEWNVVEGDLKGFNAHRFRGKVDLVAGGVPCQPFSVGGRQLGQCDERDLFPEALRVVSECMPRLILIENVRGLAESKFDSYRDWIVEQFEELGYSTEWKVVNSLDYGVPQSRPRFVLVGRRDGYAPFPWTPPKRKTGFVSDVVGDLMGANGWKGIDDWMEGARKVAPCIVGGSKKHGGPDLGPQRAKRQWLELGVDGSGLANEAPNKDYKGVPKLTNQMAARIQGFPDSWKFVGGKTAVYRQIGNAFPPPVACHLGKSLIQWCKMPSTNKCSVLSAPKQLEFAIC